MLPLARDFPSAIGSGHFLLLLVPLIVVAGAPFFQLRCSHNFWFKPKKFNLVQWTYTYLLSSNQIRITMSFSTSSNTIFLAANYNMDPRLANTLVYCTVIVIAKMLITNVLSFVPNILSNNGPVEDRWLWTALLGSTTEAEGATATRNQESSPLLGSTTKPEGATATRYQDWSRRMNRVVGNDLENIPIALTALWLAAFTTLSNAATINELTMLLKLFAAARIAHSVTYMFGISGVRSVAYFAGLYPVVRALQIILQSL